MSAAQDAYIEAQRRIAEAKLSGDPYFRLAGDAIAALEELPPEIAELDGVDFFILEGTQITDLAPIEGMTGVASLRLINTQIIDLTPIAKMTWLKEIDLQNTQIIDLTSITKMSSITALTLVNTPITDLTPIAGLIGIRLLSLVNAPITDLTPIANMTGVTNLHLVETLVTDLTPISGMIGVGLLNLNNTPITDLAPIAKMAGIQVLSLGNTKITDLKPIAGMTGIKTLYLHGTQVTDLTPIANMTGVTNLFLDSTPITDLTPIAGMRNVKRLSMNNTQITDLAPISGMISGITDFSLNNAQIADLRPVVGMRALLDLPETVRIAFKGSAAARLDARIAEIAEIEDNSERAATLFEYLKDWVPPGESAPETDPLLQATVIDGRLEIEPSLPTEAERDERLKRLLHERVGERVRELTAAAGNMFPRLASKTRVLFGLVDVPFDTLDLLSIHLELDVLAARAATGMEDGVAYTDEVRLALDDVTRLGPGLTMDHPDVELMLHRARRAKEAPIVQAEQDARLALSTAIIGDADANGPNSRAMEILLAEMPDKSAVLVLREAKQKNLVRLLGIRSAAFLSNRAVAMGDGMLQAAFGVAIANFLTANWATILAAAGIYAPWLMGTLGVLIMAHGAKQEWQKRKPKD